MTLTIYEELEQGTDEWLEARAGLVTASTVGRLITPTLKVADNDTSRRLVTTLAAERITGRVDEVRTTPDMWRGTEEEPLARNFYNNQNDTPATELGFMVRDFGGYRIGYSPDGLVGDDGLIEIKSRLQLKHVTTVLSGAVPTENMAQLQAGLLVSGRKWIEYVSYSAGMAFYTIRVYPDPKWFNAIHAAAERAEADMQAIVTAYNTAVEGLPVTEPRLDVDDIII